MKKYRFLLVYGVLLILFAVLLWNMNTLVLLGMDNSEKFVSSHIDYEGNSRVFLSVSSVETFDNWSESLSLSGWAFCETDGNNDEKSYDIILRNDKDTYAVHVAPVARRDVASSYPDRKVASIMNGIEMQASTIAVRDGIYSIYVYVHENDDNYGLIDTGRRIIKSRDRFEELQYELVTEELNAIISPSLRMNSKAALVNGALRITGWSFVEGMETDNQEIMVMIETPDEERIYRAKKNSRADIISHFENDDYLYSGFEVEIPDWEGIEAYAVCIKVGDEVLRTEWEAIDLPLE